MLLYDITRELFSAPVYPGDPRPRRTAVHTIGDERRYNLSELSMSAHAGTHIDAPLHFDEEGADIASMKPSQFYGKCTVVTISGILTGEDMERLLPRCHKRLILLFPPRRGASGTPITHNFVVVLDIRQYACVVHLALRNISLIKLLKLIIEY